jgi:protein TonB
MRPIFLLFLFPLSGYTQSDTLLLDSLRNPFEGVIIDIDIDNIDTTEKVHEFAEVEPQFPGGEEEMIKFISNNIVYPLGLESSQGIVYASFVVEKDGSFSRLEILKGFSKEFDQAVVNIILKMPKWEPGKIGGEKVRVRFTIPVNFN